MTAPTDRKEKTMHDEVEVTYYIMKREFRFGDYTNYEIVKKLPSADVAPVRHGHWIKISPAGIYECSECRKNVMTSDIEAYEHCHGCGAKMDGDENEID